MAKFIILPFFLFYSYANAQSYLGKTKEEIFQLSQIDFPDAEIAFYNTSSKQSYFNIRNSYENLYYYLVEGVCVEFVVYKPFSCNCLETDLSRYNEHCVSLGENKWVSKDYKRIYQMSLSEEEYWVSISLVDKEFFALKEDL